MTGTRLTGFEVAALRGAELLDDDELAGRLADAVDHAACAVDERARAQDLRELAVLALETARRLAG